MVVTYDHEVTEELEDIEYNLEGLTLGIPDIQINDLSRWYQ